MEVSCIARLFNPCLRCAHSFSILHFQLQNRSRPIILLLGDGLDHNGIAVALLGGDIHLVTDLFAEHRLTERCLAADSAVQRITPHGRYHLNGIRVIIVLKQQFHLIEQTDLIRACLLYTSFRYDRTPCRDTGHSSSSHRFTQPDASENHYRDSDPALFRCV